MNVFVTGASGWVGSVVIQELVGAGHRVTGLVRSDEKAAALTAAGAQAIRGTLDDADTLRSAATAADAVIHTAFNHDFSKFAENAGQDQRAIKTLGDALEGSGRPLVVTSGLAGLAAGRLATEADIADPSFLRKSETTARALADRGIPCCNGAACTIRPWPGRPWVYPYPDSPCQTDGRICLYR